MKYLLLSILLVSVSRTGALDNFMDCPGNDRIWGILRVCCRSDQLPKDCECFDISSKVDFTNSNWNKPSCPDQLGATFRLYTPSDPSTGAPIRSGQASISASTFNPALPTAVIAHGFADVGDAPWIIGMKDELLLNTPTNVILVDWEDGAKSPNYYKAVANTRMVGAMVGRLVYDLNAFTGATFQSFHMIGHSLGAHIMGYSGKEVHRLTGQKLGRISGLDPAGLGFESYSANVRVDASDAAFVDIIHTDAESLLEAGFGTRYSIGHADFYPNGGKHQPGCPPETYGILSMISFEGEVTGGACSHGRVLAYFSNSINKCRYDPPTGGDFCTMGFHVNTGCRGDHYPVTTAVEPFC